MMIFVRLGYNKSVSKPFQANVEGGGGGVIASRGLFEDKAWVASTLPRWCNDTQHNDTQHNDTQHNIKNLSQRNKSAIILTVILKNKDTH
jgi:hypothetical protein